jgi:hypothetical protein
MPGPPQIFLSEVTIQEIEKGIAQLERKRAAAKTAVLKV